MTDQDGTRASQRSNDQDSSKESAGTDGTDEDKQVPMSDESSSTSSAESTEPSGSLTTSYNSSKSPQIVHETLVKTLGSDEVESIVQANMQHADRQLAGGSSTASSSSSTFKRYKFGLTNHFLTMPDVGDQQDAKFYQKEMTKNKERERRRHRKLTGKQAAAVSSISRPSEHAFHERPAALEIDTEPTVSKGDDSDNCDLSVMGPSSPGSGASSSLLSHEPEEAWTRAPHDELKPADSHHRNQVSQHHHHHAHLADSKATLSRHVLPAGDAGLDASKCNSKAADHCYLTSDSAYLHNHQHHSRNLHHQHQTLAEEAAAQKRLATTSGQACDLQHLEAKGVKRHHLGSDECASNSLLVRFSSIMYATFLVILGCILHVSELRQKSKNSSDHIYTTIVALLGIFWLVFLQVDLQRYKRYASKYILLESIFNDHQRATGHGSHSAAQITSPTGLPLDPSSRSTTSSAASLVNDRMSMNTEVIFKKTAYKMYQQRAAALKPTSKLTPTQNGDEPSSSGLSPRDQLIPAYKFLHGKMGANFYLKCGMAAFCFGHVIHEGLRFGQQVYFFATANVHCRDSAALVAHLVTPLYSFYQLFMMFKYSNLVINRHKILAKFGLMHIIGTCATFWFRTILEEAFEDFVHKMDYFRAQNKPINQYLDPTGPFTRDNQAAEEQPVLRSWLSSLASLTTLTAPQLTDGQQLSLQPSVIANLSAAWGRPLNQAAGQNMSSTLLALMSSPISATISPQLVRHLPDSYHCAQNTLLTTKSMNALPYLYPFTIEYNLLIAATFLSLYFNIGKIGTSTSSSSSSSSSPARCTPNTCYKLDTKSHLSGSSSGTSKLYMSNINKQPSLISGHSYLAGCGGEFSDNNTSSSGLQRYSSSELVSAMGRPASSYYRHSSTGSVNSKQQRHLATGEMGEYKSNFVVNADCHAANKGLFLGFFVLLVTLVTIVIFFVTINKPSHIQLGIKINLIQEATLTSLILIVTLAGYRQIMRLNRNPFIRDKVTTDDVLMLIPLPFFFIHSLLSFRAETATLYAPSHLTKTLFHNQALHQANQQQQEGSSTVVRALKLNESTLLVGANSDGGAPGNAKSRQQLQIVQLLSLPSNGTPTRNGSQLHNSTASNRPQPAPLNVPGVKIDHYKLLTIALNLAVMLEVLVQTNFIIEGLRRCSESRYLRFKKPGRELITFAILLNITYWIVATFETKSVEQYKTEIEYYGPLPYMFISHTTLPVMLFYRYHSSVCLAEIWNRAYKLPKESR